MNLATKTRTRPCLERVAGACLLVLAGAALVGCSSNTSPAAAGDISNNQAGSGGAGDAATFSEIYPMLFPTTTDPRCNFCHSMPASDPSNGGLSMGMDQAAAYAALVGKNSKSSKCSGMPLVVANQPEMSLLLRKLSASPPCGSRMPIGGKPLSDAQLGMIRGWIAAGARDD